MQPPGACVRGAHADRPLCVWGLAHPLWRTRSPRPSVSRRSVPSPASSRLRGHHRSAQAVPTIIGGLFERLGRLDLTEPHARRPVPPATLTQQVEDRRARLEQLTCIERLVERDAPGKRPVRPQDGDGPPRSASASTSAAWGDAIVCAAVTTGTSPSTSRPSESAVVLSVTCDSARQRAGIWGCCGA